jgi:hypothetical protein
MKTAPANTPSTIETAKRTVCDRRFGSSLMPFILRQVGTVAKSGTVRAVVAWYNFCRPHMTLKMTPAVAAGLASETWSLERLVKQ